MKIVTKKIVLKFLWEFVGKIYYSSLEHLKNNIRNISQFFYTLKNFHQLVIFFIEHEFDYDSFLSLTDSQIEGLFTKLGHLNKFRKNFKIL